MEEAHVLALDAIAGECPFVVRVDSAGEHRMWTYGSLERQLHLGALATPVIETLKARGCIRRTDLPDDALGEAWDTTLFGDGLLSVIREAATVDMEEITLP